MRDRRGGHGRRPGGLWRAVPAVVAVVLVAPLDAAAADEPGPGPTTTVAPGPTTTVAPGADVPSPGADGGEVPAGAVPGGAVPGGGGAADPIPTLSEVVVPAAADPTEAAARRAQIERAAAAGTARVEAQRVLDEAAAALRDADGRLAAAQREVEEARVRLDEAVTRAATARRVADEAAAEARVRREVATEVAVAMFVDPTAKLSLAASVDPGDRLAARGALAARAAVAHARLEEATEADDAARRALAAHQRSQDEVARVVEAARTAQAAAESEVSRRQGDESRARAAVEAVEAVLGAAAGGLAGDGRLAAARVAASGSLVVERGADGAWQVRVDGFPTPDQLVTVAGTHIVVHSTVADAVSALVAAAAADEVVLDGWGYRDTARQIELRRRHCGASYQAVFERPSSSCSPPTARPGRSMHERGLAIDFESCSTRSTACYRWLAANASRFGLYNLPSEPWHWSTNGQ